MIDTYQARLSRSFYANKAVEIKQRYNISQENMYKLSHLLSSIDTALGESTDKEFLNTCAHNFGKGHVV